MATKPRRHRTAHLYIAEWMKERGLGPTALAKRLGVTRETVWRWKEGERRPDPENVAQIASALDLEPEGLYWPPGRPSIDALLRGQPDEMAQMAADIVRRLVKRG
jgi:transcriptional regulator with XRE-family HTH domain